MEDDAVQFGERLRRGGPCERACDDFPCDVGVERLGRDGCDFADRGVPAVGDGEFGYGQAEARGEPGCPGSLNDR